MSMISLLAKVGTAGALVTFSYGSVEDVVKGMLDSVSVNAAWAEMRMIHGKLIEFYTANNRYPQSENEMMNYMKNEFDTELKIVLTDPWDTNYNFFTPKYEIHSCGPDSKPRTKDDLGIDFPNNVRKPY